MEGLTAPKSLDVRSKTWAGSTCAWRTVRDPDPGHGLMGEVGIGVLNGIDPGKLGQGIDPDRLEPVGQLRDPECDRLWMSERWKIGVG